MERQSAQGQDDENEKQHDPHCQTVRMSVEESEEDEGFKALLSQQ